MNFTQTSQSNVALTSRDVQLLEYLAVHGVMSYCQVEALVFPGRDHSTILNRIKKIESVGYLRRLRVHRIRHPLMKSETNVVLQLTPLGLKKLHFQCPELTLIEKVMSLKGRQIDHDLLMVGLAESLRGEFSNYDYVSGFLIKGIEIGEPRPDGVFKIPQRERHIAVELELTQKSSERYRELIASYRVSGKYERVLYFVPTEALALRLATDITGYPVANLDEFKDRLFDIRILGKAPIASNKIAA
ncbi:MAG: hypothetical protein ACXWRA_13235 [Pseudobdellovibrionaceae bacterium]